MHGRVLAGFVVTLGVLTGGTAIAAPQTDDPRATTVQGDVQTCRSARVPGEIIDVTAEVKGKTSVDITDIPGGYQVLGVVLQGDGAYNKYPNLGVLPWKDLRAPGEITRWFVCAKPRTTTTKTTTTLPTTQTPTPGSSTSTAPTTTTSVSTTPVPQAPGDDDDKLAQTGFSGGALVLTGVALLISGAVIVAKVRRRRPTIQAK